MNSDLTVFSALMPADHYQELRALFDARREDVTVFLAEKRVLETLTGYSMYQGLLACARIPPPVEFDAVFGLARRPRFFVAVDALSNAENLGAIDPQCGGVWCRRLDRGRDVRASVPAPVGARLDGHGVLASNHRTRVIGRGVAGNFSVAGSAAWPRIRTRKSGCCRWRGWMAIVALCSAAKVKGFHPGCARRVTIGWSSRCSPELTYSDRWRGGRGVFLRKSGASDERCRRRS